MNNGNLFLGVLLGFVIGNESARKATINMANKMLDDVTKEISKPRSVDGTDGVDDLKETEKIIQKGEINHDENTRDNISY